MTTWAEYYGDAAGIATRASSSTIEFFVGELAPHTQTAKDADGAEITLTGLTLELIVEDRQTSDVVIIPAASITISGADFTFTPTAAITAMQRILHWSLRDTTTNGNIVSGIMPINFAANEGTPVLNIWDGGSP